jgi:nucleoside-diphosphate-sugar epimerase
MKKILVTGASGFIGRALCRGLIKLNFTVYGTVRNSDLNSSDSDFNSITVSEIGPEMNWINTLEKIDCIIHCAGMSHTMNDENQLDLYRLINTEGTKSIATQAAKTGVKRFIFLSSVKVNGESTNKSSDARKFTYNDVPNPKSYYAISKFEAEKALLEIAYKTGLEVVILRLPVVYGNGVKGNLKRLIKLINSRVPLPFGSVKNKRSLIGIDNLVDVIIKCIEHPNAIGQTFLLSDGKNLSTPELIQLIASAIGQPVKLFSLPLIFLKFFSFILGKKKEINRLTESLEVDDSYTKEILNWTPPVSVEEGIRRIIKIK